MKYCLFCLHCRYMVSAVTLRGDAGVCEGIMQSRTSMVCANAAHMTGGDYTIDQCQMD